MAKKRWKKVKEEKRGEGRRRLTGKEKKLRFIYNQKLTVEIKYCWKVWIKTAKGIKH